MTKGDRALLAIGRVLVSAFVGACLAAITAVDDWVLSVLTFVVVFVATLILTQRVLCNAV